MRPFDGMPAAALLSHRLMAFGLPPDSRSMISAMVAASASSMS
jgi:hypothetical protein